MHYTIKLIYTLQDSMKIQPPFYAQAAGKVFMPKPLCLCTKILSLSFSLSLSHLFMHCTPGFIKSKDNTHWQTPWWSLPTMLLPSQVQYNFLPMQTMNSCSVCTKQCNFYSSQFYSSMYTIQNWSCACTHNTNYMCTQVHTTRRIILCTKKVQYIL